MLVSCVTMSQLNSDIVQLSLNSEQFPKNMDSDMTVTKHNGGRKGAKFEDDMEKYRAWFATGTKRTQHKNAIKLRKYCEWHACSQLYISAPQHLYKPHA